MRTAFARSEAWILGTVGFVAVLLVWELFAVMNWTNPILVGQPSLVWQAALRQAASGQLGQDTLISLSELGIGFAMAVAVGLPLGLIIGWYRWVDYALDPYLWFFYTAPTVAFYPLFMIWFGLGKPTIIAITFLLAVFPLILNTITGVRQVDPIWIRAARSFGASNLQLFIKVIFPGALPLIVAGLRLSLGRGLIGTVIGEFFGAAEGLGFRITIYGLRFVASDMMVPILVVVLIGTLGTQALRLLEMHLTRWKPEQRS